MPKKRRSSSSALQAIRRRGNQKSNIWYFHSPKTDRRWELTSDIAFMHTVLMEGDLRIQSYALESPTVFGHDGESERATIYDARVLYTDGHYERREFKHSSDVGPRNKGRAASQLAAQAQAAHEAGESFRILTELDLQGRELELDNWLLLCGAINRCRRYSLVAESRQIDQQLRMHDALEVGYLLALDDVDPALMLAAIARELQRGLLETDLVGRLITVKSLIQRPAATSRREA